MCVVDIINLDKGRVWGNIDYTIHDNLKAHLVVSHKHY